MHPGLGLLYLTFWGAVAAGAIFFLHSIDELRRQEEAHRSYASASERYESEPPAPDAELVRRLLDEVETVLRELRRMPPGPERNRRIRLLRSRYHPDRNAHMASLRHVFDEVARVINSRTDSLLV
ncbi:hypothetical protein WJX81_004456 [Elliptochloris bilobata]|uniref:J domain-containing protein n=1 Tax=Elliptochloris bilobata TaxID=381761 RepID=A0AAW1QLR9_9CHLO